MAMDEELGSSVSKPEEQAGPSEVSPLLTKDLIKDEEAGLPDKSLEAPPKEEKIAEGTGEFASWKVGGFLALYVVVTTCKVLTVKATFHVLGKWLCGTLVFIEIGQAMCMVAYLWDQSQKSEEQLAAEPDWDLWESDKGFFEGTIKWRLCLSSANELSKNLLFFYALTVLPASEVALFLGGDIIFVSLMNVFYRGRDMPLGKLVGVLMVFVAVLIEGVSHFYYTADHEVKVGSGKIDMMNPHFFAIGVVVLRSFLSACQQFVDERLTQTDKVPPLFIAGTHGVLIVPFLCLGLLLPWGLGPHYDIGPIFKTFFASWTSVGCAVMLVLTGAGDHYLNKLGLKNAGPLGRTVAKSARPTAVWLASLSLGLVIPFLGGEKLHGMDSFWHAVALTVQFLGTMTYAGKSFFVDKTSALGCCAPNGLCYVYGPPDKE